MFNWEGCPLGLFDVYMEVGDVCVLPSPEENRTCIEIWVASTWEKDPVRPECADIRRRPIYGILKQIVKLADGKPVCLIFQCDDSQSDMTACWAVAISLLVQELKKMLAVDTFVFFTGNSREALLTRSQGDFHKEKDRSDYLRLFDMTDILVTGQPNRHASAQGREIHAQKEIAVSRLRWLLDAPSPKRS